MSGARGGAARRLAVLLGLALAGCGGILSETPKRQLYRLEPALASPASMPHLPVQLLIAAPQAPAGLDTARVALSRSAVSLDYFADAEWTDRAPLLVQTALVDAFERSGAVAAVARDSVGLRADLVLETELRDFQAVYDSPNGPPHVSVALTAKLIKIPERKIVAQISVARQVAAAANDVAAVVRAFDEALGAAVAEVVTRTVTNPGLSQRRVSLHSRTRFVHAP
jgi:cholesterol transport system auxiliary component